MTKEIDMSPKQDFGQALKGAVKSTIKNLSNIFSLPEEEPFNLEVFETLVEKIVNLRTPGLEQDSKEFDESYATVVDEISSNCQGRRRYLIITAQDILQQEQNKQNQAFNKC